MGGRYSHLVPKYIKNFNVENRIQKQIKRNEQNVWLKQAPRHPSTVETLKKLEGKAVLFLKKKLNSMVSTQISFYTLNW
jgi:hypothetical protein